MITWYALITLLAFLYKTEATAIGCKYGEQTLCGTDGFTYYNMCDFQIVQTVRPQLAVKHLGPCKARKGRLLKTLRKVLEMQKLSYINEENALRRKKQRFHKPLCKENKKLANISHEKDLTRMLLAHMTKAQTLSAFNFENNTLSTQGSNNVFKITTG